MQLDQLPCMPKNREIVWLSELPVRTGGAVLPTLREPRRTQADEVLSIALDRMIEAVRQSERATEPARKRRL